MGCNQGCSGGGAQGSPLVKISLQFRRAELPLKILIQTEIICDNMPNFSQFVRIWHYFTFEIQLFQFTSVPFLKVKPVLVIFPIFRMVFWLISLVVIVHCLHMTKPWNAGNCVFKDLKIKHFLLGNAQDLL